MTAAACVAEGLDPWRDPHNLDPAYARVRVRETVLPTLERELGPGVAEALARTAEQLREDAAAFQDMI
ncbi:tRNA lysidine(34) synthetase TilS, partial [Streptomyces scabiei]